MTKRSMGWLPDVPSVKDYTEGVTPGVAALKAALKTSADLRAFMPPIEDQGNLGSCTAQAAVTLYEYGERKFHQRHIDRSRLFVYYVTRRMLGWENEDSGAYLRSAMKALLHFGAPPERYWPYDVRKFKQEPPAFVYCYGQLYQALSYLRLDPNTATPKVALGNIKKYLAAGLPSMFGFPVYDEFMEPASNGFVAMPARGSAEHGGHAIVACGYDDARHALLIRNSWGTGWGLDGYAWLDYDYVLEGLAVDWWTLLKSEWIDEQQFEV